MNPKILLAAAISIFLSGTRLPAAELYQEPYRPQFHFTPERNWMNDPNGMVYFDGEYHLFYQFNPFGDKWGHMSWGHAVSPDMVHWQHLSLALAEENGVMIFSGSAVVDWQNSSGFGKGGRPPLVAIYTGHYTGKPLQNQQIAFSNDKGRTWTKYSGNPVLDIGEKDFRDPKVFWHEKTGRWIMAVSWPVHRKVRFYASPNLKDWTHLSDFGPAGSTEGIWECPDLFPLQMEGKAKGTKWALIVNVGSGAPAGGSGCQYFIGDFDGEKFTVDPSTTKPDGTPPLWADWGRDFYAAVSWSDVPKNDGRRLWLGWMSNWNYANDVPTSPWRSAMSIPRSLSVRQTGDGLRLIQQPVRELKKLRGAHHTYKGKTISQANAWFRKLSPLNDTLEIICQFGPASEGREGFKLFKGEAEETIIGMDRGEGRVFVDRSRSGNVTFNPAFAGVHEAPAAVRDRPVKLHIFVDKGSVEVFVNDGEQVLTELIFPSSGSRAVEAFSSGKESTLRSMEVWDLKSSWIQPGGR